MLKQCCFEGRWQKAGNNSFQKDWLENELHVYRQFVGSPWALSRRFPVERFSGMGGAGEMIYLLFIYLEYFYATSSESHLRQLTVDGTGIQEEGS